ncbi:MAG: N(4)-(beta-N-acetylglucosaminyl)-L-asparaginase [Haliscomenobacter sp.]
MPNRRSFLSRAALATLAASLGILPAKKSEAMGAARKKHNPNSRKGGPVTIATWDNRRATAAAWEVLKNNGYALDAVEQGAWVPEADPKDTSVGYGGFPDRDGNVTLDACIMNEHSDAGSVTFLEHILHPVSVARRVMEKTPHVLLSGEGALQFALSEGFEKQNLLTEEARLAWERWKNDNHYTPFTHDTIGILALDQQGRLCGACTTSGWAFKMRGRVGDSPIIGAGLYVDNEVGAATATGQGELMLKTLSSFTIVELMSRGATPQEACEDAVARIARKFPKQIEGNGVQVGVLALGRDGHHGAFGLRDNYSYALFQDGENKAFKSDYLLK